MSDLKPGAILSHQHKTFSQIPAGLWMREQAKRWEGREAFPHRWLSKQTRIMSTPGNLWPLILILIPTCICCQGSSPRERFPFAVVTTRGHQSLHIHQLTETTASSKGMLPWSFEMQACVCPTDCMYRAHLRETRFNFSHTEL